MEIELERLSLPADVEAPIYPLHASLADDFSELVQRCAHGDDGY